MADKKATFVSVSEVSIANLIDSAKGQANGQRKSTSNAGKAWAQTALWLHSKQALETFDSTKEIKEISEAVRQVFKDNFLIDRNDSLGELDEESTGRNARTGKSIEILDKDLNPKWSSWEETKLPIAYCGDLAKIIKAEQTGELLVSEKKVLSRHDALALAKTPEPAIETIRRSLDLTDTKWAELGDDDKLTALNLVADLYEKLDASLETPEVAKAA